MEFANLLNYRLSTVGEFIGSKQTNNIPLQTAPENCFTFRYITTKETIVLIDSLKQVNHSVLQKYQLGQ